MPIIFFHGGNSTAPYSLKKNLDLIKECLIFVPDTIGHPGNSDQKVLSSNTLESGEWASDVIDVLGFEKIVCMGESFGGGVLAKLMCVSPGKKFKRNLYSVSKRIGDSRCCSNFQFYRSGIPMANMAA